MDVGNGTFVDLDSSQGLRLWETDDGDQSGGDSDEEGIRIAKGFLPSITTPKGATHDRSYTSANDGTSTRQSGKPTQPSAALIQTQPTVAHGKEIVYFTDSNEAPTITMPAITQPRDATRPKRAPLTAEQKTKLGASLKRKEAEKKAALAATAQKTTDGGTNIKSLLMSSATPSRSSTPDAARPAQGPMVPANCQAPAVTPSVPPASASPARATVAAASTSFTSSVPSPPSSQAPEAADTEATETGSTSPNLGPAEQLPSTIAKHPTIDTLKGQGKGAPTPSFEHGPKRKASITTPAFPPSTKTPKLNNLKTQEPQTFNNLQDLASKHKASSVIILPKPDARLKTFPEVYMDLDVLAEHSPFFRDQSRQDPTPKQVRLHTSPITRAAVVTLCKRMLGEDLSALKLTYVQRIDLIVAASVLDVATLAAETLQELKTKLGTRNLDSAAASHAFEKTMDADAHRPGKEDLLAFVAESVARRLRRAGKGGDVAGALKDVKIDGMVKARMVKDMEAALKAL